MTAAALVQSATVDDLSAYLVSGRLKGRLSEAPKHETDVRTPAQGIEDGIVAESLGFRRAFIAERFDLKEAGALLGAVAARTSRIGVGSGLIAVGSRHPLLLAALGATMHAAFGPRLTLGLGRGAPGFGPGGHVSMEAFADHVTILQRLWDGECFDYEGPAGTFEQLRLADRYEGAQPEIWYGGFGLPRAARVIAKTAAISGLLLPAMLTPLGVSRAVANVREACERSGRDPSTVRICASVVTAPDLSEEETQALAHARAVTYLQPTAWGRSYEVLNDWDPDVLARLREHRQFTGHVAGIADLKFHRTELAGPASLLPEPWMQESCALGDVANCVRTLQSFRDAGADEIATYGSTPGQNAGLIAAWRSRSSGLGPHRSVDLRR